MNKLAITITPEIEKKLREKIETWHAKDKIINPDSQELGNYIAKNRLNRITNSKSRAYIRSMHVNPGASVYYHTITDSAGNDHQVLKGMSPNKLITDTYKLNDKTIRRMRLASGLGIASGIGYSKYKDYTYAKELAKNRKNKALLAAAGILGLAGYAGAREKTALFDSLSEDQIYDVNARVQSKINSEQHNAPNRRYRINAYTEKAINRNLNRDIEEIRKILPINARTVLKPNGNSIIRKILKNISWQY